MYFTANRARGNIYIYIYIYIWIATFDAGDGRRAVFHGVAAHDALRQPVPAHTHTHTHKATAATAAAATAATAAHC
jgi:hypothetical protein